MKALLLLALCAWLFSGQQAHAQLGRYPVLASLGSNPRGDCRIGRPNSVLARTGITRIAVFLPDKQTRRISVATDASGKVLMVSALYAAQLSKTRTESEYVTAMFTRDGSLRMGRRSYRVMRVPASSAEDREVPLSPADAAAAMKLGIAIAERCASVKQ